MSQIEYLKQKPDLAGRLHYYEEIDSTNHVGKALAREGKINHVVIGEKQTAGRGRLSRTFESPKDWGLYLSYVLPPMNQLDATPTLYLGSIVFQVLTKEFGEGFAIKWVNDLLFRGKKICGILAENTGSGIVAGIGINLNTPASFFAENNLSATSIQSCLGINCSLPRIGVLLIEALDEFSERYLGQDYLDELFAQYRDHLVTLHRQVQVIGSHERFEGVVLDLLRDGNLLIDTGFEKKVVTFGDVSIRGMDGYI